MDCPKGSIPSEGRIDDTKHLPVGGNNKKAARSVHIVNVLCSRVQKVPVRDTVLLDMPLLQYAQGAVRLRVC